MSIETRDIATTLEVRTDGDGRTVTGRAAPFYQPTPIGARFTETFVPGSFQLDTGIALHGGHEAELPVSGPGRLWEQRDGLYGEWRVLPTVAGNDLLTLISIDAVHGLSVGFLPDESRDVWDGSSGVTRYGARLLHVAAVPHPAYDGAQVLSVRDAHIKAAARKFEITLAEDDQKRGDGHAMAMILQYRRRLIDAQEAGHRHWDNVVYPDEAYPVLAYRYAADARLDWEE